jgi:hypothetical protein
MFCDSEDLPSPVDNRSNFVMVYVTPMHSPNHTWLTVAVFYIKPCNMLLWNMAYPGGNTNEVNSEPFQ